MTTTQPGPMPPHAAQPAVPASGWAPVPTTPAAAQQGFAPVPRRRLDPAQVWTLVVTGVIAVVALVVGLVASGSDEPSREEQLRDALNGAGISGDYYDDYDYGYYDESGCDSVFC